MASMTIPSSHLHCTMLETELDAEVGGRPSLCQVSSGRPSQHKTHVSHCSITIAFGLVLGVIGFLAATYSDGFTHGNARAKFFAGAGYAPLRTWKQSHAVTQAPVRMAAHSEAQFLEGDVNKNLKDLAEMSK